MTQPFPTDTRSCAAQIAPRGITSPCEPLAVGLARRNTASEPHPVQPRLRAEGLRL